MRLIITIFILLTSTIGSAQTCIYSIWNNSQSSGGSELILVKRPNLGPSAYEIFIHRNVIYGPGTFAFPYYQPPVLGTEYVITDSCSGKFKKVQTFFLIPQSGAILHPLHPFTGDTNDRRIHPVCPPQPVQTTNKIDSFIYQRAVWASRIIYLPYTCGKWQIKYHQGSGGGGVFTDSCTNYEYPCTITSNPTNWLPQTSANPTSVWSGPCIQFSNLQANSMPGYASDLDFIARAYQWTSIPINPIDPEGDSLAFSSSEGCSVLRAIAYRGADLSLYGNLLPLDYNVDANGDTISVMVDTVDSRYECIPGQSGYPNCTIYNPINNPFDCDSTFSVDPQTGEVRFYTKTPDQHVEVTIKCDEYRNGTWLSSSYRIIRIHTIDSGYVSKPIFVLDSANVVGCTIDSNLTFYACAGSEITIPFDVKEAQGIGNLTVSDNHSLNIPASSMVYANNSTDSVRGLFSWQTLPTDSGWYYVVFNVADSACGVSNYIQTATRVMRIYIGPNYVQTIQANICNDTLINGVLYTSSGQYAQYYNSFIGCDSTVHFNLTRYYVDTAISYGPNHSLTANATNATFQWIDCSTMLPIPGDTNATFTATKWGTYACIITQNGCTDTTDCKLLMVAPEVVADYDIVSRLYPNPSKGTYQLELNKAYQDVQLEIRTVSGQVVWQQSYEQLQATTLKVEAQSGVYILYIKQGNQTIVQKLLKW